MGKRKKKIREEFNWQLLSVSALALAVAGGDGKLAGFTGVRLQLPIRHGLQVPPNSQLPPPSLRRFATLVR